MSITCPECSIRYASDLPACPWCGHGTGTQRAAAQTPAAQAPAAGEHAPATHTESRVGPPPPPPPPRAERRTTGSVTYDLADIPGPEEEWEPVDDWIGTEWQAAELEPERGRDRLRRWGAIILGTVALLVFGALLAEFVPLGLGGSGEPAPTAAAPPPTETVAPTTAPPPPTTQPPATTQAPPTTLAPIEPVGAAIDVADLRLREAGLGILEFGADGIETVGRLVATFGQPDADTGPRETPDGEPGGFCVGVPQRAVTWGPLTIYNELEDDGVEIFRSVSIAAEPSLGITTLSGLAAGDSLDDLRNLYDGFGIEVSDGIWELRAGSDGRLLLWGTTDGSSVITVNSSLRCD